MEDNHLVVHFPKSTLNNFITCKQCAGYLRFAHTIIECGHSFCRLCLFDALKKNAKNSKCPSCEIKVDANYNRSIRKDPYKQSIVDLLYPEFQAKDVTIIKRCKDLFPDVEIEAIKDEYDYTRVNYLPGRKKKIFENKFKTDLQSLVSDNFNMTLNEFSREVLDDETYGDLIKKKQRIDDDTNRKLRAPTVKEEEKDNFMFSLFPKTDED